MGGPGRRPGGSANNQGDEQLPPMRHIRKEQGKQGTNEQTQTAKDKAKKAAQENKEAGKDKAKDKAEEKAEHLKKRLKHVMGKIEAIFKSWNALMEQLGITSPLSTSTSTPGSRKAFLEKARKSREMAEKLEKKYPKIKIPKDQKANLKTELLRDPNRLKQLSNAQWIYASIKLKPFDEKLFKEQPLESLFAHLKSPSNGISFNPHTGAEIIRDIDLGNPTKGDIVFIADKAPKQVKGKKSKKKKEFRFKQAGILQGVKKVGGKHLLQLAINEGGSIKIQDVDPKDIHGVFHFKQNTTKISIPT